MTQKELLYLEDAYKHEDNTICICNEIINMLEDEEIISFFEKEIKKHTAYKDKIMSFMEDLVNE